MTADDILDNDVTDGFVFTADHTQPKQVHIALGGSSKHKDVPKSAFWSKIT